MRRKGLACVFCKTMRKPAATAGEPARKTISSGWTGACCNKAQRSGAVTEPGEPLAFRNRYVHTLCKDQCVDRCAMPG